MPNTPHTKSQNTHSPSSESSPAPQLHITSPHALDSEKPESTPESTQEVILASGGAYKSLESNSPSLSTSHPLDPSHFDFTYSQENSKFTTNLGLNTLENRFRDIFASPPKHLAFLMGFLRISGFIHLHDYIKDYARFGSIRILVGINVDALSYELETLGHDPKHQAHKFKRLFHKRQRDTITKKEEYSINVDSSILALTQALQEGKLQIRMVREKNVHAKFYLFYDEPRPSNKGGYRTDGSLIVGSSNLSENGLKRNIEFNLETQDTDDLLFALSEFNTLWKSAIPLEVSDIDSALEGTYLQNVSVEDLYYKLLLEHFGESFLYTDSSIQALFRDYKPFDYQIHAVQEGIDMLRRYHGFFLSDVVGLGKTLIASIIAKKLQVDSIIVGKILLISPPAVQHSWKKHFDDIRISGFELCSFDSTHKIENICDYELIIIDESHNLRNTNNNRYDKIQNLCKEPFIHPHKNENIRKKVVLLSATPQNNTPQDIKNQIQLFCDSRNSGIEGVEDLDRFFSPLIKKFKDLNKKLKDQEANTHNKSQIKKEIEDISNTLRDDLLSKIMIRRTRGDIQSTYAKDMKAQGLKFPTITPPQDLTYDLDKSSFELATQTLCFLAQQPNTIGNFTYSRYLIYPNLTQDGQKHFREAYGDKRSEHFYNDTAQQLQAIIQQTLFKRFDSSLHAFKCTLQAQIRSHTALLKNIEKYDIIYLPKHNNNREKLYEAIESDDDEAFFNFIGNNEDKFLPLNLKHFKPKFLENIRNDLECLSLLLEQWKRIDSDPKLHCLKDFIAQHRNEKLVIFTEAKATAEYLSTSLAKNPNIKLLEVNSANRIEQEKNLRENFDANYDKRLQKDTYNIIISTDVLAEGINLHRSNIIVNYDTPYNATRLMQRIGRINRIGTSFDKIHIYNFKPTKLADLIININQKAFAKIQSFHYTLGEDSAIYDEEEEFDSKSLFAKVERLNAAESKETPYKNDLRELYNTNRQRFEHIKLLPSKSRSFIELDSELDLPQSYTYIKSSKSNENEAAIDTYFPYHIAPSKEQGLLSSEPEAKPCDFYTMADFLKAHRAATPLSPKKLDYQKLELHYKHIDTALEEMKKNQRTKSEHAQAPMTKSLNTTTRKALTIVKNCQGLELEVKTKLCNALEYGLKAQLDKQITKIKADHAAALCKLAKDLPNQDKPKSTPTQSIQPPQIQLSITAYPSRSKSSTAKHHGEAAVSLSDFSGCQGGGEGSLVSLNDQADNADSAKSTKKPTPHRGEGSYLSGSDRADNADSAKSTKETTPHQKPTPHKG